MSRLLQHPLENNIDEENMSLSLRVKLVLSYLGVALGAILLIAIVFSIAVHNYFYQSQISQLRTEATNTAHDVLQNYQNNNNSWTDLEFKATPFTGPFLVVVVDDQKTLHTSPLSSILAPYESSFEQAVNQSLAGQEGQGSFQGNSTYTDSLSGAYISEPIKLGNKVIGAILLVRLDDPQRGGFSPSAFLANVNQVILIAGIGIALIVIAFSLFLTRRLTLPLISLTNAAEEMKAGNYTQRVEQPQSMDELGRLAVTFNAMADKIQLDVNELLEQEKVRRDLIANIAHDLITPLTAIQGYSEAIADNVISDPIERQETAQLIGREVQRLRRLVSDMQNMTSLEGGRVKLEIAPLDMYTLVSETLAVIAPECEQACIGLHNELVPTLPQVLADSDRITQVLLNLLDNARRHTPEGGHISVGARPEGKELLVWVKDTGVGIDSEDLPRIFERFYRADRSRNAASGGSGLGLAIIKVIITTHGGRIWVQSTPGHGTTVFFTLHLT